MLTWKQRGLLQAVPHQAVPKNNQTPEVEDVSHLSPTRPPWMEENGGYGPEGSAGSGGGSSDLRTRYYYKEKVWAETATPPVYLIHSTKVPPVSLNDMPDQRAEKDSLGYTENDHTYVHPYSTGPLIVGDGYYDGKPGSTYWVQKPASPAGNTEFTGGTLTARPAVPAVDEDHPAKPAIPFIPHGGKEHMNGQSQFDQGDGRRYINNRGEVLGHIYGDPYLQYHGYSNGAPAIWRNGRGHNLDDLTNSGSASPAYENIRAQAINDKGVIAAMAYDRKQKVRVPVVLFPIEIKAFKRGTLFQPGVEVRTVTGEFGYETVMMENADSESSLWSGTRDYEESGTNQDLTLYRKLFDDDLVKIVLKWPVGIKPAGASLKLLHDGMQVDATQPTADAAVSTSGPSRLNFYKADGTRITNPATDLQIADLANAPASSYLSKILTDGEVTMFIEGAESFGDLPVNKMTRLGGALLKWEFTQGTTKTNTKLFVYRGGFFRFVQPAGAPGTVGTFEFRDGKGRVRHTSGGYGNEFKSDVTDLGSVIASFSAKSGKTYGSRNYLKRDKNGHIPPGWWVCTTRRTDFDGPDQRDKESGSGATKKISQGGYVRWKQDDETDPAKRYTRLYRYDASNPHDATIGKPISIMFKYDLMPIEPVTAPRRSEIQIHPDGECTDPKMAGTAGCIGIQTFKDCKIIDAILQRFHGLKIKVQIQ